ncbi:AMP-binding protein [Actinocrispum sp. NPDC049592]|uniref:AMP-binding protein n=1 Tax=Actinocrispum sp. NPDC049592 TaxID=3154835 RepID=UPI00343A7C15
MVIRSSYPDVEIPDVSLPGLLFGELSEQDAQRPAVIDGASGVQYTYAELVAAIDELAAELTSRGIGEGDVVAMVMPNTADYPVVFHGVLKAGAAVSPMNPLSTDREIAYQVKDSGARLLLRARDRIEETGASPQGTVEDLAALPYSSGTTGLPKGVLLTHRNLVANTLQVWPIIDMRPGTRSLAVLPLYHIYGITGIMNATLYHRGTLITLPRFDFHQFLSTIAEHRIDNVFVAPPIAVAMAKSPLADQFDLSCVKVVLSAAAPLDADIAGTLARRLNTTVLQGYGLTESSPCTHGIPVDRPDISRGSIGVLMPSVEARVVDPVTGEDADRGELWCRGPNIMQGYLNNPDATAATVDTDGFLHTGDIVTVTEDGVFTVVDRLKELIKYKGFQVAPAELEAVLLTHPGIADAAVIGVADPEAGEVPKAFVTAADPALTAEDIQAFVAERVAPYKKVRQVEFIDQIPKSPAGKILRKILRAREI